MNNKKGKFVIQYGREPFFTNRMRREAEGALHHGMSLQTGAFVVLLSQYSTERTLNELKKTRKYFDKKKDMAKAILKYKKQFPKASVESLGFD